MTKLCTPPSICLLFAFDSCRAAVWSQTSVVLLFDCAPLRRLWMWFSVSQEQVNIWIETCSAHRAPPSQSVCSTSESSFTLNLYGFVLHPTLPSFHPWTFDDGNWNANWWAAEQTFGVVPLGCVTYTVFHWLRIFQKAFAYLFSLIMKPIIHYLFMKAIHYCQNIISF